MTLPAWLTRNDAGAFLVDADALYPQLLNVLDLPKDQYGLEVAYQCAKLKVHEIVADRDDDPRKHGKALVISIASRDKEQWRLVNFPEGRGWHAATKGREARQHYARIRSRF